MKFNLSLLSLLFISYHAFAQDVPTNKGCEIEEILNLGTQDIDQLKGTLQKEEGLLGTHEYWEATRKYKNAEGTIRYLSLTSQHYVTYMVEKGLSQKEAEDRVQKLANEISMCIGPKFKLRHDTKADYKTIDIDHQDNETTIIPIQPSVTVKVVKQNGFSIEVSIYFPDK